MEAVEIIKRFEEIYTDFGYPLVFFSSFVEITPMGWTIPGGFILAGGGFYAFGGKISLWGILVSGWLGAWLTFLLAFFLGRKTGFFLVQKLHQEKNAQKAKTLLKNHGPVILTTSMLANLTRFWVAYVAGVEKYRLSRFLFYSGIASLTWSSLMVIIGYLAGAEKANLENALARIGALGWIFLLVALFLVYIKSKQAFKEYKGKRL